MRGKKRKKDPFYLIIMQKILGKLTKVSVFALKEVTILEHGLKLA